MIGCCAAKDGRWALSSESTLSENREAKDGCLKQLLGRSHQFSLAPSVPEGATIVEEVTNAQNKPVAVIYTKNGKTYRRNLNGTIQEIKNKDTSSIKT